VNNILISEIFDEVLKYNCTFIMESQNSFSCTMCFFRCNLNDELICHCIRYHKHDPKFRIQCNYQRCGATYRKWKSFKQHLKRQHSNVAQMFYNIFNNDFDQDNQSLSEEGLLQNDILINQNNLIDQYNDQGEVNIFKYIIRH